MSTWSDGIFGRAPKKALRPPFGPIGFPRGGVRRKHERVSSRVELQLTPAIRCSVGRAGRRGQRWRERWRERHRHVHTLVGRVVYQIEGTGFPGPASLVEVVAAIDRLNVIGMCLVEDGVVRILEEVRNQRRNVEDGNDTVADILVSRTEIFLTKEVGVFSV